MHRCMLCGKETEDLQTIESVFEYDAEEVAKVVGRKVEGSLGGDTLTVCKEPCADIIRSNSSVIIRDEPFQ